MNSIKFSVSFCIFVLMASSSALAAPTSIKNCTTITNPGSYLVKKKLNASGDCIIIGTSFVTLDLDGQTIEGDGTGAAITAGGISRRSITVKNGTVTNFDIGIDLAPSTNVSIKDISIHNMAADGITVGNRAIIESNVVTQAGGIGVDISCCSVVSGNSIETAGMIGIRDSGQSTISNNTIRTGSGTGIDGGVGTSVIDNAILSLFGKGVTGDHILIQGNNIVAGDAGVEVICPSSVKNNTITWNQPGGMAIVVAGGAGCSISDNATN